MDVQSPPRGLHKSPYTLLLLVLVALLMGWPMLEAAKSQAPPSSLWSRLYDIGHGLLFTVMLAALLGVVHKRRRRVGLLTLVGLAFLGIWADHLVTHYQTTLLGQGFTCLFLLAATTLVIKRVLAPGDVTADRIVAALCAYLFLGMLFSTAYWMLWSVDPTAFQLPNAGRPVLQGDFTYFSFVTLTTLGYGDIQPVHAWARSLAYMEAMAGQMYVAVVIARLVALEIMHGHAPEDQSSDS